MLIDFLVNIYLSKTRDGIADLIDDTAGIAMDDDTKVLKKFFCRRKIKRYTIKAVVKNLKALKYQNVTRT